MNHREKKPPRITKTLSKHERLGVVFGAKKKDREA
jgi:hypothetical protein